MGAGFDGALIHRMNGPAVEIGKNEAIRVAMTQIKMITDERWHVIVLLILAMGLRLA